MNHFKKKSTEKIKSVQYVELESRSIDCGKPSHKKLDSPHNDTELADIEFDQKSDFLEG